MPPEEAPRFCRSIGRCAPSNPSGTAIRSGQWPARRAGGPGGQGEVRNGSPPERHAEMWGQYIYLWPLSSSAPVVYGAAYANAVPPDVPQSLLHPMAAPSFHVDVNGRLSTPRDMPEIPPNSQLSQAMAKLSPKYHPRLPYERRHCSTDSPPVWPTSPTQPGSFQCSALPQGDTSRPWEMRKTAPAINDPAILPENLFAAYNGDAPLRWHGPDRLPSLERQSDERGWA